MKIIIKSERFVKAEAKEVESILESKLTAAENDKALLVTERSTTLMLPSSRKVRRMRSIIWMRV